MQFITSYLHPEKLYQCAYLDSKSAHWFIRWTSVWASREDVSLQLLSQLTVFLNYFCKSILQVSKLADVLLKNPFYVLQALWSYSVWLWAYLRLSALRLLWCELYTVSADVCPLQRYLDDGNNFMPQCAKRILKLKYSRSFETVVFIRHASFCTYISRPRYLYFNKHFQATSRITKTFDSECLMPWRVWRLPKECGWKA